MRPRPQAEIRANRDYERIWWPANLFQLNGMDDVNSVYVDAIGYLPVEVVIIPQVKVTEQTPWQVITRLHRHAKIGVRLVVRIYIRDLIDLDELVFRISSDEIHS